MCTCQEPDLDLLTGEILRYLHRHSAACDTTEGIANWWIKRQRVEDTLIRVQAALDRLVAEARLEPRLTPAGRTLYQLPRGQVPSADTDADSGQDPELDPGPDPRPHCAGDA